MSGLFNYDNKVMMVLDKIINVFYVSIIWLIFSLPIFTIGASTTALYYTVNKVLRHNRSYVMKEFLHSFKTNFKQATLLWVVIGGIAAILRLDMFWISKNPELFQKFNWLNIVFLVLLFLDIMWGIYVFPYLARFENTNKQILKNGAIMACIHFPKTLLTLAMLVVAAILVYIIRPLAIVAPALCAYGMNYFLEGVFRKYMTDEQRQAEDEANNEFYN